MTGTDVMVLNGIVRSKAYVSRRRHQPPVRDDDRRRRPRLPAAQGLAATGVVNRHHRA